MGEEDEERTFRSWAYKTWGDFGPTEWREWPECPAVDARPVSKWVWDQVTDGGTLCIEWTFLARRWRHLRENPDQPLWRASKDQAHGADDEPIALITFKSEEAGQIGKAYFVHPQDDALQWAGRGRRPTWLNELLDEGYTLNELRGGQTIN